MVSPAVRYTVMRFMLFGAAVALFFALGMRGFWLLILALLMSGLVSFFVLSSMRAAMSARLSARFSGWNRRMDERARAEDDDRPEGRGPDEGGPAGRS